MSGLRLLGAAVGLTGMLFASTGAMADAGLPLSVRDCDTLNGTYWYVPQETLEAKFATTVGGRLVVRGVSD